MTPARSVADVEAAWAARVRENREQVDRIREVPDGRDFYAPVTSFFRADPRRTGDWVLDQLVALARPGDTWLDIGAGGGRYALPLALRVAGVVAVDPSPGMLDVLRGLMVEHDIRNIRILEGRWPPDPALRDALGAFPVADVALIAHVGYDIEAIGSFLDAMEAAAKRACVAVLMDRQPASVADPFWPRVHGEDRVPLPALDDFVELLEARGRTPTVAMGEREARRFETRDHLEAGIRRQLWIDDRGAKERRFRAALAELVVEDGDGFTLVDRPTLGVGIVSWRPGPAAP